MGTHGTCLTMLHPVWCLRPYRVKFGAWSSCAVPKVFSTRATTSPAPVQGAKHGSDQPIVITIDGPAASGKGSLARRLACMFGLAHLDTGRLYRAVALKALAAGLALDDEAQLAHLAEQLSAEDVVDPLPHVLLQLHDEATGAAASRVSALPAVRSAVTTFPRTFATTALPPGARGCVIDGRDVGTVLFPDAQLKLFITAALEVRAQRRLMELHSKGQADATFAAVLASLRERDSRDSTRATAPLRPADDAVVLDSSLLDEEGILQEAVALVAMKLPGLTPTTGAD